MQTKEVDPKVVGQLIDFVRSRLWAEVGARASVVRVS